MFINDEFNYINSIRIGTIDIIFIAFWLDQLLRGPVQLISLSYFNSSRNSIQNAFHCTGQFHEMNDEKNISVIFVLSLWPFRSKQIGKTQSIQFLLILVFGDKKNIRIFLLYSYCYCIKLFILLDFKPNKIYIRSTT